MINKKELNIKLTKFANLDVHYMNTDPNRGDLFIGYWLKHRTKYAMVELFTDSIDTCHDLLFPRLKVITITNGYKGWTVSINQGEHKYVGENASMPMAICLAVETIIDNRPIL